MPLLPADLTLEGSGRVVRPFPFLYNFPIEEGLEFSTNLIGTDDGTEQRVAVRDPACPRRVLRAELVAIEPRERLHLEAQLFGWNAKPFAVPMWQDAMDVAETVEIAATAVVVREAEGRELQERLDTETETMLMFWRSHEEYEIVRLLDIEEDGVTLTLENGLDRQWLINSRLVPLRFMFLVASVEIDRIADVGGTVDLEFIEQSEVLLPEA
jgi:hypothetical protein